jgi:hypothetical protein
MRGQSYADVARVPPHRCDEAERPLDRVFIDADLANRLQSAPYAADSRKEGRPGVATSP